MEKLIEEFIIFINDLVNDEFDCYIGYVNSKYYFLHGGCLQFAKVLNHYLKDSHIVIRDDYEHFAIEYKGSYYDATGKINDNSLFQRITNEEIKEIEYLYGINEIKFKNQEVDTAICKEINNSSGNYVKKLLNNINK